MTEEKDLDIIDIITFIGAIVLTAAAYRATGSLFWALIIFGVYWFIKSLRRSEIASKWRERVVLPPMLESAAPLLLPGPKEQELVFKQDKPIDVRVVDAYETSPFWKRVTQPLDTDNTIGTATPRRTTQLMGTQAAQLQRALKRLPKYVSYSQLPNPPSPLSVPIGIDSIDGNVLWGDFSSDGNLIHALVAGQTGSGKDALLRLWFTTLTMCNKPSDLQFVILDGKIDWLSPALAESAYMAIAPAGGIKIEKRNGKRVNVAQEDMVGNLDWIFAEIEQRSILMTKVGAVDLAGYYKRTGVQLPYIFVLASDVGGEFANDLEMLIKTLIMRGRSYGIRLIISMQNPVGEDTKWRSQIGLVMSGYQQNPDHDRYIMGINVNNLLVRPSQLPNPDENAISKGLFVVRHGSTQHLVRTAHLPEEHWFKYIETTLPKKRDVENQNLLSSLLAGEKTLKTPLAVQEQLHRQENIPALTTKQMELIRNWTLAGKNKTEIMQQGLGFTNGVIYAQKKDAVEIIINAVKRSMQ